MNHAIPPGLPELADLFDPWPLEEPNRSAAEETLGETVEIDS
ncbi:MAG: hypothetical protein AAF560_25885 [Acidobacteriota bacterium]